MNLSGRNKFILGTVIFVLILAVIFVPKWQSEIFQSKIAEDLASFEAKDRVATLRDVELYENSARTTLAQIAGGLVLLAGLYITYRQVQVNEEGKITERFSKAVELLGSKDLELRLGGIYALERIARDSQKDHWTVIEVLTAFVRENSHKKLEQIENQPVPGSKKQKTSFKKYSKNQQETENVSLREDIQATMTVIGRRKWIETESPKILDLRQVKLCKVNLSAANLNRANLSGADLRDAALSFAKLSEANLMFVNLSEANLMFANLNKAYLFEANLSDTILRKAFLHETELRGTNLSGADLQGTNLSDAKFLTLEQILSANYYDLAEFAPQLQKELEGWRTNQADKNTGAGFPKNKAEK